MKFAFINLILFIICARPLEANIDINEIKNSMYNDLVNSKKKYYSIKKIFLSPYNKKDFIYTTYLDSLKLLSEHLEKKRKNLFLFVKNIDLSDEDIFFIDKLNRSSIVLFNIINGFGSIYHTYLLNMHSNSYSLDQYSIDIEKLLSLEKNISYLDYS